MGVIPVDILVLTALQGGLANLRENVWILDDILSFYLSDDMTKLEYGAKEVAAFKEFFLSNKLPVYQEQRVDTPIFPCVTVYKNPSTEMTGRTALGDYGQVDLTDRPNNQPVMVYKPFTPAGYDPTTGYVIFPDNLDTSQLVIGQFLVSQRSGKAYVVIDIVDGQTFQVAMNIEDDLTNCYVTPVFCAWNLHREFTYFSESITVECNGIGNPVHAQWIAEIIRYLLLRTKEVYLEHRGFELSTFQVGELYLNQNYQMTDRIFTIPITLSGDCRMSFIKYRAPKIEAIVGNIYIVDGPKTPEPYAAEVAAQGWHMAGDPGAPQKGGIIIDRDDNDNGDDQNG